MSHLLIRFFIDLLSYLYYTFMNSNLPDVNAIY